MILAEEGFELNRVTVPNSLTERLIEERQFEFSICSFNKHKIKIVIIGVYRSPSSDTRIFLDRLCILVDYISKIYDKIIVGGDFNIDVLKNDNNCKLFKQSLMSQNMIYLVNFPTRVSENSETAIDNFLVRNIDLGFLKVEGLITGLSDHDGQLLEMKVNKLINKERLPVKQEIRKFSPENLTYFSRLLSKETWSDVYLASVESKYDNFYNSFRFYFEQAFPKVLITKTNKTSSWITEELKSKHVVLIKLTKEYRKNKNLELKIKLNKAKKDYKLALIRTKSNYFQKQINKSTNIQKTVWKLINSEVGVKERETLSNITLIDGTQTVSEPKLIANIFNDHFVNIVKDLDSKSRFQFVNCNSEYNYNDIQFIKPTFRLRPIDKREVEQIIDSFKSKTSSGPDEIPITVIKAVKTNISPVLSHLINSSFVSGIFPIKLKQAKIVPIHKKHDKKNVINYRPISVLPTISKIYEKAVYLQFKEFLETYNLLDKDQHGFRSGRSVVSAAVSFIETIIESVDKGKHTIGVFMDISKAFDSVKHSKLIEKLKALGVENSALNWFQSYLSDRSQYVEINYLSKHNKIIKASSHHNALKFGVPQGSILGPLLFLCYMGGIDRALTQKPDSNLYLYADDANLVMSSTSLEELEIHTFIELENIGNYLKTQNLQLNSKKTNYITFKTPQNRILGEPTIVCDSFRIEKKNNINFLGVTIDSHLNFDEHVHKLLIKINSGVYALRKMSYYCNLQTLKNIYFAYVHSHISFCIALYGSTKQINMENILKQQKKAIRLMLGLKHDDSAKEHFRHLQIFTVYSQYIFECILTVKNQELNYNFKAPDHPYNTRAKNEVIPSHRLKFFEKKPTYMGNKFLKYIPQNIKTEKGLKFKKKLKDYLLGKALYSIDELSTSLHN